GEVEQHTVADLKAVFDLANLEIGWIRFDAGSPPSFKMVRAGQEIGNAPSEKHRQGLRLRVRLAGDKGVAREFSSTAATVWNAIDRLHDEFERNRGKYSGKLPYVRLAKLEQVKNATRRRVLTNVRSSELGGATGRANGRAGCGGGPRGDRDRRTRRKPSLKAAAVLTTSRSGPPFVISRHKDSHHEQAAS